jgi:FKBP-type peptidyl-prolyl cis-trans isomerase 2
MQAFVKEVKEKTVVLDTNHPLAGKVLTFDVKIVGVEAPRAPVADGRGQ